MSISAQRPCAEAEIVSTCAGQGQLSFHRRADWACKCQLAKVVRCFFQLFLGVFVLIFREQRDTKGMKVPLHSSVTCERKITNFVEGHTSQVGLRWLSWRWVLLPSISACHLPHDPRALPLESESSPSDIESRPNPPCDLDLSSLKHASGRLACGPASDAHSRCF